jgi:hypothetical protein
MFYVKIKDSNDTAFLSYDYFLNGFVWDREQMKVFYDNDDYWDVDGCIEEAFKNDKLNQVYQFDENNIVVERIYL